MCFAAKRMNWSSDWLACISVLYSQLTDPLPDHLTDDLHAKFTNYIFLATETVFQHREALGDAVVCYVRWGGGWGLKFMNSLRS